MSNELGWYKVGKNYYSHIWKDIEIHQTEMYGNTVWEVIEFTGTSQITLGRFTSMYYAREYCEEKYENMKQRSWL